MTAAFLPSTRQRTTLGQWGAAAAIAVAAIWVFHNTLSEAYDALGSDDPLGWLAIVPFLAIGIGIHRIVVGGTALQVKAFALDVMVAAPLAVSAAMIVTFGARTHGALFWAWRIDVPAMVAFIAACTVVVYGTETFWQLRAAFLFALLAWPVLWAQVLAWVLPVLSSLSSTVTFTAAQLFGWGTHATGDSVLWVRHGQNGFPLAIAPLCAGSSTMTGWLLVGGALTLTTHGHRRSKFFWLMTGCVTAFAANAARLIALVAVGHYVGANAAANVHLWLGGVALAAVVLGGILTMNRFGVSFRVPPKRRRNWTPPRAKVAHARPLGVLAAGALSLLIVLAGPGINPAAALVGPFGEGRSLALSSSAPALDSYSLNSIETIDWGKQFFGRSSRWIRYRYDQTTTMSGPVAVTVDAQVNSDPDRFTRYSVDRCLEFHHHDPRRIRKVDLGFGLLGDAATWQEGSRVWQTLSWVIPVRVPDGTRRYERVLVSAEVPTAEAAPADGTQEQALQTGENALDHIGRQLLAAAVVAGKAS